MPAGTSPRLLLRERWRIPITDSIPCDLPADRRRSPAQPTALIADIDNDNPLVAEEHFGPALPIICYSTIDEAVPKANGLEVGLVASIWSWGLASACEVADPI